ncbi:WAT1-related protein At5g64700-like isoform X2 [Cannabis sativa]|uniref:WAT1-related protein At5g64700 isoform X2 n=1 Tax=Cannabis sativa TaxID=3483 RepID=UPI0029C9C2FA|nr:WAT1-related protein At5g64700 isoform X2 [Cannabis sativa]XP_060971133.1 WAT1-related protein At5g64700-like isoform X2 [Cannabis sativa]
MGLGKKWFLWSQVVIGMLLVQAFATGMQILSRIILVEGTFVFALMTYRHLVAALCVAPLAFYFERVSEVNKCNKNVWFWLFCNALAGVTCAMGLFYYGLRDTTATYATNFLNLIPIVTFVLSILLKLERLNLDTKGGKVKCIGALMCVGGALTTSLYKGKAYYIISHHHHHDHTTNHSHIIPNTTHTNWPLGTLMLVGSCFCYSTWFLIQVKLKQIFPYKYWSTMLTCLIGALQSAIVGLCLDRSVASWRLGWNLQLITIIYSGSLATAATFCLLTWAISIKGATYPSMFNPLTLIFVSLSEAIILV